MALAAFQRALCDLIASPDLCLETRADPSAFLERYDLSPREQQRLQGIVWQRGMSTSCTLYRSNRVTPIYTLLHQTCLILGDRLKDALDAYWAHEELRDLEFKHEIQRFAQFLKRRTAAGLLDDPFLEEVLHFELALNELRFAPRRLILDRLGSSHDRGHPEPLRSHPLVRVVRFRHDPAAVLGALACGHAPRGLPESESFLVLSAVDGEVRVENVDAAEARLLWRLQSGTECFPADAQGLINSGLVRPASGSNSGNTRAIGDRHAGLRRGSSRGRVGGLD